MTQRLLSKNEMKLSELELVDRRLNTPEHAPDWYHVSMPRSWQSFQAARLFAFFQDDELIGLAAIDGPLRAIDPAWWIDLNFRHCGNGGRMIRALAARLKAEGVTGVGPVTISGPDDPRSRRLVDELRGLIAGV